jgi:hypothetical protein
MNSIGGLNRKKNNNNFKLWSLLFIIWTAFDQVLLGTSRIISSVLISTGIDLVPVPELGDSPLPVTPSSSSSRFISYILDECPGQRMAS